MASFIHTASRSNNDRSIWKRRNPMSCMTCSVRGCQEAERCKGFCQYHYNKQWQRNNKKKLCSVKWCRKKRYKDSECATHYARTDGKTCKVKSCNGDLNCRGYCANHYARWKQRKRTNSKFPVGRTIPRSKRDNGCTLPDGHRSIVRSHTTNYWRTKVTGHPLNRYAERDWVLEHRLVMYEKLGPGKQPCFGCGEMLRWSTKLMRDSGTWSKGLIFINHLNEDGQDNRISNLRVSCNDCNRMWSRLLALEKKFAHVKPTPGPIDGQELNEW